MNMGNELKKIVSLVVALVMIISISIASIAATTIEDTYKVVGTNSVSTITVPGYNGDDLMIFYPTNMTETYPLITWGNGTWTVPTDYTELLSHIASYGFIVVASYNSDQGTGELMVNAADYMIAENSNPNSMFYNKVDIENIGAVGHSQGACGAVNATVAASYIDTVIPMSLVSQATLSTLGVSCDVTKITVPTFLTCGVNESWGMAPPFVMNGYYNDMITNNPNQPVAKAALTWSMHNDMKDSGTPDRYKGYVSAWLMFQLKGDTTAAKAFAGNKPELPTNSNWQYVGINNIN